MQASSGSDSYTLDLPFETNLATPIWLGHPEAPAGTFASLDLPLTAPESGDSLLVTVFFQEKEGGFLRLSWKGATGEQLLSGNFYEGVSGMGNQRTLLIPASVVADGGTLILQCGDTVLDVEKLHLEWLQSQTALVSPEQEDTQVISALGKRSDATDLDGQPAGSVSPSLDGSLVTVPLVSAPQRIEQGVEFSLQLDGVPQAGRISFTESGLPWTQHFVVWINQQRAGIITPNVPDLRDAGFAAGSAQPYVGWRESSIYLPVALLKSGLNSLQLSVENDDPATSNPDGDDAGSGQPLAVNHLVAQFDYTQAAPAAAPAPIAPASAATPPAATESSGSSSTIPSDELLFPPIQPKP